MKVNEDKHKVVKSGDEFKIQVKVDDSWEDLDGKTYADEGKAKEDADKLNAHKKDEPEKKEAVVKEFTTDINIPQIDGMNVKLSVSDLTTFVNQFDNFVYFSIEDAKVVEFFDLEEFVEVLIAQGVREDIEIIEHEDIIMVQGSSGQVLRTLVPVHIYLRHTLTNYLTYEYEDGDKSGLIYLKPVDLEDIRVDRREPSIISFDVELMNFERRTGSSYDDDNTGEVLYDLSRNEIIDFTPNFFLENILTHKKDPIEEAKEVKGFVMPNLKVEAEVVAEGQTDVSLIYNNISRVRSVIIDTVGVTTGLKSVPVAGPLSLPATVQRIDIPLLNTAIVCSIKVEDIASISDEGNGIMVNLTNYYYIFLQY